MTKPSTEAVKVAKQLKGPTYKESLDKIAENLVICASAIREINGSKLKRRVVLLLLRDMTNMGMNDIETVLNAAARIDVEFLKP